MRTKKRWPGFAVRYLILTGLALAFVFPFVWMIAGSLKTLGTYYERPVRFLFPDPAWGNYTYVFERLNYFKHMFNSVFMAGSISVLQVVTSSLAAFAFATLAFRGKGVLFGAVLSTMMVPACVVLVPLFIITQRLHLINTYAGMILPFAFTGFGIFLLRQSYMNLPRDLFHAAEIDGAGYSRIFAQVYTPLIGPSLLTLLTLAFISHFNSILWPQIAVSSGDMMVLSVKLISMVSFNRTLEPNKIMAMAAVCILPPLVLFASLQKLFVQGYVMSGMKG